MSLIRVDCPQCNTPNAFPKQVIGKVAQCCECNNQFPVQAMQRTKVIATRPVNDPEPLPDLTHCTTPISTTNDARSFLVEQTSMVPRHKTTMNDGDIKRAEKKKLARARLRKRKIRTHQNRLIFGGVLAAVFVIVLVIVGICVIPSLQAHALEIPSTTPSIKHPLTDNFQIRPLLSEPPDQSHMYLVILQGQDGCKFLPSMIKICICLIK